MIYHLDTNCMLIISVNVKVWNSNNLPLGNASITNYNNHFFGSVIEDLTSLHGFLTKRQH